MDATRKCPYCAETIAAEALRCRHCRSRLTAIDPERWHRSHPERRVAGVAAAVAHAFAVPVGAVRLAFIVLTFFHLLGPVLYGALWLIIPFAPGQESPLERGFGRAKDLAAQLRGAPPHASGGPFGGSRPAEPDGPPAATHVPGGPHP
jgi:phage shock protein PspC (stress-responsive transcriptional regulator)